MKIKEVILRAMSGEIKWNEGVEVIGISPRSLRRWRQRYEDYGYGGLYDRRTGRPSPRRAPYQEMQNIQRLYREKDYGFNVSHYQGILKREYQDTLSYHFLKQRFKRRDWSRKRRNGVITLKSGRILPDNYDRRNVTEGLARSNVAATNTMHLGE